MEERQDKKIRKTLNSAAGPQCTPPNRPCGDRCIPPNWECHTGVNARGPKGGNSAYRSNVIGAAGNFEAAARDLVLLAKPGSRRNVFKTVERVQKSTYKGIVELIPYPQLSEKEKYGKSPAEIQAEEQKRYSVKVVNTFGLVLGASIVGTLGVFAFRNRKTIQSFVRRTASDIQFSEELNKAGVRFRVQKGVPTTFVNSRAVAQNVDNLIDAGIESATLSFPKRIALLMTGNMQYSDSAIQGFRGAIRRQPIGAVPYYAQGPGGNKASFIRQQSKGLGLLNITKGFRKSTDSLSTIEKALSLEAKEAAKAAALRSSSEGIAGIGKLSAEEQAFKDVFDVLTGSGRNNRTLVKQLTTAFYSEVAGIRLQPGQSLQEGLRSLYVSMRNDLGSHIRTNLPKVTGRTVKSDAEAWSYYLELSDAKRQQLLLDYQPSNKAYNRVANSYIAKEWADALASSSDIPRLIERDIEKSQKATDTLLRRLRRSVFNQTSNPINDPKAVDFVVGTTDFIDKDLTAFVQRKKALQDLLDSGRITQRDYDMRVAELQARPAMTKLLNRIRFEEGYSLSLLKRSDLVRALEQSEIELDKSLYTRGGALRKDIKKEDLVSALEEKLKSDNVELQLDGVRYRKRARRDSHPFNWGLDGRNTYDAEDEQRLGKPCGKSFIEKDKKCKRGAGSTPRVSNSTVAALVAGASITGLSVGAYALAVAKRKQHMPEWVAKAAKKATEIEVPETLNSGRRYSPYKKTTSDAVDSFADETADAVVFHINGFDGFGHGGDLMMDRHAGYMPNAHHVAVSNEEFNVRRDLTKLLDPELPITEKAGYLVDNASDALRGVLKSSLSTAGNPVSQKLAAHIKAYRDKYPNKPIIVSAWSAGTMVSAEADELLRRMGINDVSYVMYAPFHYGVAPKPKRSTYIGGKYDQLRTVPGMVTDLDYTLNSDHQYNTEVDETVTKAMRWYAYGRTDAEDRLDKKCGASYISANEKCEKQPVNNNPTPQTKKIITTTGVAAVGAALASLVKEVVVDTKIPDAEVPPMSPPEGLYDSFKPGDLIYRGTDWLGSKRAHYAVYLGKINGRHTCVHTQEGFGRGKAYLELRTLDLREQPSHTSWKKAKRLSEVEPPPLTNTQVQELIQTLRRKHVRYEIGRMNCENYARAIAGDIPRSTQMEKMSWLNKKVAGFLNDLYANNKTHIDVDYVQQVMKTVRRLDAPMPIIIYLKQLLDTAALPSDPVLARETLVQGLTNLFMAVLAQEGRLEGIPDAA